MARIRYDGDEFELLDEDTLSWVEAAAIERATGKTFAGDGDSIEIMAGFVWASIKRKRPTFKLSEFMSTAMGETEQVPDEPDPEPAEEGEPDPLETPDEPDSPSSSSELSTPPSSTSSGESPGLTGTG